jgi:2-polyprenyl-6-methoxyphenol hydroxylase-like FAD-dependent oxidoreductase
VTGAEVVIAGAGPVGMFTAALLDAAGVSVVVLERETERSPFAKATTMHPRSLEVLSLVRTGKGDQRLSDTVIASGTKSPTAHFAVLPAPLDFTGLDTEFNFSLFIPQSRTERILAAHLAARGVPVRAGQAVTGFDQDEDGVRVRAGGTTYEGRYLVGADGAHSAVRKQAGIGFPGTSATMAGFGADAVLAEPPAALHTWDHRRGWFSALPMPDGVHRVFGAEPGDVNLTEEEARRKQAEPLTAEDLRGIALRVMGSDLGLREVRWTSRTTDTTRHAEEYRAGRVLLAGDAAHVHLPAGGQGLNVGLQDAANLAWKLAAELRGRAPRAIVDGAAGYQAERLAIAELLAGNTLAQSALMVNFSPAGAELRALMSKLITGDNGVSRELAGWLSALDVSYPPAPGAHALTGSRMPDPLVRRALAVDRFVLADFTGQGRFDGLASDHVQVVAARPWSGLAGALVRPDGYVAHAAAEADPAAMAATIGQWLLT